MPDFTGMLVQVTLKQSGANIHGRVRNIVAGQTLTLEDAFVPNTGHHLGSWTVQSTAIGDLNVLDGHPAPVSAIRTTGPAPVFPPVQRTQQQQQPQVPSISPPFAQQQPQPQRQPPPPAKFVDPAILSYGKSPAPLRATQPVPAPVEAPATPVKSSLAKAAESLPLNANGSPFVAEPGSVRLDASRNVSKVQNPAENQASPTVAAKTSRDTSGLGIQNGNTNGEDAETGAKKKTRRGQKKKVTPPASSDPPPVMNIEVSRNGNDMNGDAKRGKGWRQTPLLQPTPSIGSPAPPTPASKKQSRRRRDQHAEMKNGWATEEATDVQDMGDFDFDASNKLFDKQTVFNELRQGDTTADEDRLVSHNKILATRPGTHGGKNLHPTENVLSPKIAPTKAASNEAAESSSDADTELNFANGRSSSRHSVSRAAMSRKAPSRQSSAQADMKHPLAASVSSEQRMSAGRPVTSLAGRPKVTVAPRTGTSPMLPERTQSPHSTVSFSKNPTSQAASTSPVEPHFVIQPSSAQCPVLHPRALETLEAQTISAYGLSREAITESAARAVAEAATAMFSDMTSSRSRRGSRANTSTARGSMTSSMTLDRSQPPVIVILAGDHTLGARAIAAARHLLTRKCRIIVAEAFHNAEDKETQDEQMRTQTAILRRLQRGGKEVKRGNWKKALGYIKNLTGPPAVIIDALLGGTSYESLVLDADPKSSLQQEAREMIDWANRSRAPVLSLGCPSGASGLDGSAPLIEGEPLAIRPERVLAFAAPMQGLLEAVKSGERWEVHVADIGLNIALREDEAVEFGEGWVVELKFQDGMDNVSVEGRA
ncbi:enhancer of mRNA decapping [Recurvomyces mirabilis]|nr:enhancer of mRNA decapping [Recurvomyces mirabilis]